MNHQILKKSVEILRKEGVRSLWIKILAHTFYRRLILIECPINQPIIPIKSELSVTFSLLGGDDLKDYIFFSPESDPFEILSRLDAGHVCFLLRYKGNIVHASWASFQSAWIDYLGRDFILAEDEVYNYGTLTAPEFRGFNLSAFRSSQMQLYFHDAGYRRIIAAIFPTNKEALHSAKKAGYHIFGSMGYVKLGKWKYNFCQFKKNVAPRTPIQTIDRQEERHE